VFLFEITPVSAGELENYLQASFSNQNNTGCWCELSTGSGSSWRKFNVGDRNEYTQIQSGEAGVGWSSIPRVELDGTGCTGPSGRIRINPGYPNVRQCIMKIYEPCLCVITENPLNSTVTKDCMRLTTVQEIVEAGAGVTYVEEGNCQSETQKILNYCCCKKVGDDEGLIVHECGVEKQNKESEATCSAGEELKTVADLKSADATCGSSYTEADLGKTEEKAIGLSMENVKSSAKSLNPLSLSADESGVINLIGRAIKLLIGFVGSIALALYIYSGLLWMTSAGNSGQVDKAKNILIWATLGVIVMLGSYVLVDFIFKSVA